MDNSVLICMFANFKVNILRNKAKISIVLDRRLLCFFLYLNLPNALLYTGYEFNLDYLISKLFLRINFGFRK